MRRLPLLLALTAMLSASSMPMAAADTAASPPSAEARVEADQLMNSVVEVRLCVEMDCHWICEHEWNRT